MKYFIFFVLLYILVACQLQSDVPLHLASTAAIVEMHKTGQFNVDHAIFLKESGEKIDGSDVKKIKDGTYSCDYFVDNKGIIREARVRPTTYKDRIRYILANNANYNPKHGIPILDIDCDSLQYKILGLFQIPLEDWPDTFPLQDTMDSHDFGRAKIISIVDACGVPSPEMGKETVQTFWSMVHHNTREVIAYFYLDLERLVEAGALREGVFALSTDRLLSEYNYPQVYGSQIVNWKLYPIENIDSVDYRRAAVGLEPLEEYLENFDLD